jgi:hypothetical protein
LLGGAVGVLTAAAGISANRSDASERVGAAITTTLLLFLLVLAVGVVQGLRGSALAECVPVVGGVTAVLVATVIARSLAGDESPLVPVTLLLAIAICAAIVHACGLIVGRTLRPGFTPHTLHHRDDGLA